MRYRLIGVNGLGEELFLGETDPVPRATLSAWPLPYRAGDLSISFLTAAGPGGGTALTDVSIFDLSGRKVRTLVHGEFAAGHETMTWDGRDRTGRPVSSGVYYIRSVTANKSASLKLVVVR